MNEFELKLGATTYVCSSNAYDKLSQNWSIKAKFHDLTLDMSIPMESKVPMDKVILFITTLHETLKQVRDNQKSELTFLHQLT